MYGGKDGTLCPYGSHRSIEPKDTLPQLSWRLDTSLPITENEVLIKVKFLNINAASFSQICSEENHNPIRVAQKIQNIVATRGKMHNPITNSGGTLMGEVEQIGIYHPAYKHLKPGDEICTLVSLNVTPLVIESVETINMQTGQIKITGYAVLFERGLYTLVPHNMPTNLFLAVFGEAGSVYEVAHLCKPSMTVMVVGATEKIGILCLFALRCQLGSQGKIIAVVSKQKDIGMIERFNIADQIIVADIEEPLSAYRSIYADLIETEIDFTVDCSNIPNTELFAVLATKDNGCVYYANPAANCSAVALGAEGIGKELEIKVYRGYINGHVDFCVQLVDKYEALAKCFLERYNHIGDIVCFDEKGMHANSSDIVPNIIINDPKMEECVRIAKKIGNFDTTVMIVGESGTGKEVMADIIYQTSVRCGLPFLKINCSAISDNLLESELFGYEAGSFTGALKNGRAGYFEMANKGTLLLDEIGDMPMSGQVKLLRVLQSKEVVRVGGSRAIPVDVRVIAATNRNLKELIEKGEFREDLYYRLNVVTLHIPPLRERKSSIYPLARKFLYKYNERYMMNKHFSERAWEMLMEYDWPGNVREMENMIQRLLLCTDKEVITGRELENEFEMAGYTDNKTSIDLQPSIKEEEIRYKEAAGVCRSTREVAKLLHVSQSTAARKLKKFGILLK